MRSLHVSPFLAWSSTQGIVTPLDLIVQNINDSDQQQLIMAAEGSKLTDEATQAANDQTDVLSVPLNTCIIGDSAFELADRLSHEKSLEQESKFAPWIDILPTLAEFEALPRFWTPERREFVSQYDCGQLEDRMFLDQIRLDKAQDPWALACVDSRCNVLPGSKFSLTPMLDMFNHDSSVKTTARVEDESLFLSVASKSLVDPSAVDMDRDEKVWNNPMSILFGGSGDPNKDKRGVFISYGDLTNLETLSDYGFVRIANECNVETFQVRMLARKPTRIFVDANGSMDNVAGVTQMSELRLQLATTEELKDVDPSSRIDFLSERNELEMWALIGGELEEAVNQATTGAIEAAQLKKDPLVARYLQERAITLRSALGKLQDTYPDLFSF